MISQVKASLARTSTLFILSAAVIPSSGCKSAVKDSSAKGASGAPAAAAGPCAAFISAVCDKAGKDSSTCQNVTSTAELLSAAACRAANQDVAFAVGKLTEMRKICDQLSDRLCKEIGEKTSTCNMVKTQTKTFQPDRCMKMTEHYAEVLSDLKRMESANQPLAAAVQATISKSDAPAFGPEGSKVTLVEFSDFQCPYCAKAAEVTSKIKEKYGNKVRFVFRQFPLSFHDKAHVAAEAALAANAQGKFWELHDLMFANQGALDPDSLEKYAKKVGINAATFKKALDSKQYTSAVDADVKLGGDAAVTGTPSLFLNGTRVSNPTSFDEVSGLIEAALKS